MVCFLMKQKKAGIVGLFSYDDIVDEAIALRFPTACRDRRSGGYGCKGH
jgi:hypothetical protein